MKEEIARIIKHYAQNENSAMLKYYPNDINDIALQLHKAFIQAHVKVLNTMVSNCHKVDISDNEFKVIFDYEIKYNIAHLTKLLEDE